MIHVIPPGNWTTELASTIINAKEGDTITVTSEEKKELALRAISRICPEKNITVEVLPVGEIF
jgi:hypothetical protein